MAAKAGFKDLLLKKGEKIALAACAAAFALLLFMGLASGGPEKSTAQMIKDLESATSSVKTQIGSEATAGVNKLPPWVDQTGGLVAVPSKDFLVSASAFEPISWPSLRKDNPKVLKPVEGQVDVFLLALGARDRRFELDKDGVERLKLMGVIKTLPVKPDDAKTNKANYDKSTKSDKKGGKKGGNSPPPAIPGGGRFGGMPGGMPGAGMPGTGEGGMPGMPGMPGGTGTRTTETIIEYVTPTEWEVGKWKEAETVHPTRLAVVQMAFPLKAQLQEVQRALRLPTLADAIRACAPVAGGSTGPGGPGVPAPGMPPGPGSADGEGPPAGPGRPGAGTSASGPGTLYTTSPEFLRLEVQRRRVGFDGKPLQVLGKTGKAEDAAWETFEHSGTFIDAFLRYETPMYEEKPKKVKYVERVREKDGDKFVERDVEVEYEIDPQLFLRTEQGLSAPLPRVADNMALDYPPAINLWTIHDNARRLAKLLENPDVKKKFGSQFERRNGTNPYSRGSQIGTQGNNGIGFGSGSDEGRGGLSVPPSGPGEGMGGYPGMPGPGGRPGMSGPGMSGPGMSGPGMPGGNPNALTDPNAIGAEFILIRFLDPTLLPGESYKYRARLVMRNPNFGKKDQMATEADADKLEIESPDDWFECPQTASLPAEFHLFAGTAKTYETAHTDEIAKQLETLKDSARKPEAQRAYLAFTEIKDVAAGKKAVVQVQWWLPQLILPGTNSQEPIGAWVTADLPVGPGEFIGRKALVPLPLWSAKTETYVMSSRKLQKAGIAGLKAEEIPPGQIVNFTTPNLLVDFDGRKTPVAAKDKDKEDNEVANELLVLRSDGTVEVLSEVQATADKERGKRFDLWTKWVADVMKRKELGVTPPPGTGPGPGGRGDDR